MEWNTLYRIHQAIKYFFLIMLFLFFLSVPPGAAIIIIAKYNPHWLLSSAIIALGILADIYMILDVYLGL